MNQTSKFPNGILGEIPETLRNELFDTFNEILTNFRMNRWEPAELNGGKFCEVVYSIIKGNIDQSYPAKAYKPPNMVDACKDLEKNQDSRSFRIQIPRMLVALYEIRNNRGVGHIGGDVNPNHMDANVVVAMCKWVLAELIRVFHDCHIDVAVASVEALTNREVPIIWEVDSTKRVLDTSLSKRDRVLILLYSSTESVYESDMIRWLEEKHPSNLRSKVLLPLHDEKYIEFNQTSKLISISPTGTRYVERNLSTFLADEK